MSIVELEEVLVVPTEVFHGLGHFQGFTTEVDRYLDELLQPRHVNYRPRGEMEEDPSFKQLIPYVIFRHTDANGEVSIFVYTRGKGQGETRLRKKKSAGIGGHISSVDADADCENPYLEGMRRELEEEVAIDCQYTQKCVGMINDDETEVGRVHLGVVHLFDVETPDVHSREEDILEAGFYPIQDVLADLDGFETWSQIALRALFG
ncbi:MAG: phosphoesterase [Planctomycetales bacterium]|nr:phosphoesterase [Planctomycetales bacterium]